MPVDKFGRMSDAKTRDTGVSLTYINNNYIRSDGSTPVSGSIDMIGNTLYNIADPVNGVSASLTLEDILLKENGGYNIADAYVNMNYNPIKNLATPEDDADAVTKKYVDDTLNGTVEPLKEQIKEKVKEFGEYRPIIAVHASYHGDLIEGDFQFTFSGNSVKTYKKHDIYNGFLMPHSGYIKRFELEATGLKFPLDFFGYIDGEIIGEDSISIFTLILIKKDGKVIDLGTLKLSISAKAIDEYRNRFEYTYSFRPTITPDLKKYKINAKDLLNIRSELNTGNINRPVSVTERKKYEIDFHFECLPTSLPS